MSVQVDPKTVYVACPERVCRESLHWLLSGWAGC